MLNKLPNNNQGGQSADDIDEFLSDPDLAAEMVIGIEALKNNEKDNN